MMKIHIESICFDFLKFSTKSALSTSYPQAPRRDSSGISLTIFIKTSPFFIGNSSSNSRWKLSITFALITVKFIHLCTSIDIHGKIIFSQQLFILLLRLK